MPVFFGSGNIITKAKTVNMSSFIFTEPSEIDIVYKNLFKEYTIDTAAGFTEKQNVYYDPFKYNDYLDRVTSTSFPTNEVYIGEMYNTFFDAPSHNLEYVLGSAYNAGNQTNLIDTKYTTQIHQALNNLIATGISYGQLTENIQRRLKSYSHMTLDQFDKKKEYALNNINLIEDSIKELGLGQTNSKYIIDALYFGENRKDAITGSLNPLNGSLNLNIVAALTIKSRLEHFSLNRNSFLLDSTPAPIAQDIGRSIFEQEVPILQSPDSGLYYLKFDTILENIDDSMFFDNEIDRVYETKNLVYGSPKTQYHPINNFFHRYIPKQAHTGDYAKVVSDLVVETEFYAHQKNDILINLQPIYISDSDKTFIRSIFYIELDDYQDYLGYVPYIKTATDSAYIPDEQFLQTKVHTPDRNIFKFRYEEIKFGGKYVVTEVGEVFVFYNTMEARYAGYHKDYDTLYEYINDLFLSTNITSHDAIKPHETIYYRPESNHPTTGGSHTGHAVPHIVALGNSSRLMDIDYIKDSTLNNIAQEYRFAQIVSGRNSVSQKLFEFDEIYHDLDQNAISTNFNFVYDIVNARLPDCLSIDNSIISGSLSETEQFLNRYSYESWIQEQNLTIDIDYTDFNPEQIKEIEVTVVGRATTKGTIDIIDSDGFEIGDKIHQKNESGILQGEATITKILFNYEREFSILGAEPKNLNIIRYEIDNIEGSFNASDVNQIVVEDTLRLVVEDLQSASNGTSNFVVLESEVSTASGLIKTIDLFFPINNNYTYDKDRFLLNVDGITDREDRHEWLTEMRNKGHYRFDISQNINEIQQVIDELKTTYSNGTAGLTQYQYEEQLNFLEISKGSPEEEAEYERLETIDKFTFDCSTEISEKDYYDDVPERVTTRGYPIYVSCN
jgi:hypothetical protein